VAEKVNRFARSHEAIVAAIAKQRNLAVPPEVGRFFAAAQAGRWEETTNLFASLKDQRQGAGHETLQCLWPAIVETFGVAQQAHNWPPQALLDYGNAILGSLRPGMVYLGGNDAGRFIPSLLTETGDDPAHIVLTQNGFADNSYVDYLRFRYGDQLNLLTADDSQKGFATYLEDAQILPGEDVHVADNRVQVSGQVAVMQINELLVRNLMQKNPDLSFALEESFPLKSFYASATTLGPITELGADAASSLTPERAAQSLDYWRGTTQSVLADPEAAASTSARDAYAKLILGQANLFLDHKFSGEAEQAYQFATTLSPAQPEAVFGYANLLINQKRIGEAAQLVQTAASLAPDNTQFRDLATQLSRLR
jgi:tetratricopeptide (TPR) repeat protein